MAYAPVQQTLAPHTPEEVERYRKLAEALMASSQTGEPVEHWMEGVGRLAQALSGTLTERKANKIQREGEARGWEYLERQASQGGGYGGGTAGGETAEAPNMEPVAATGDDADMIIRTVIGEAAGEDPVGQQAVAAVILNRARQSGKSPTEVVLAKNQFEPWGSRASQLRAIDPNSEQYRRVAAAVLPVLQGQAPDPTGGATHFYAPKAQAALGRSTPSWARGQGQDIGNHRFYSLGYEGGGRHGIPAGETADIPGAEPVASAPSPDVMAHITGAGATPAAAPTPRGWNDAEPLPYSVGDELPRALTRQGSPPPGGAGTVPLPPRVTSAGGYVPSTYVPASGAVPDPRVPITGAEAGVPGVTPAASVPPPPLRPPYDPLTSIRPPVAPAAPPVHPLARVPQARPEPPVAPAAPATTGTVAAPAPARPVYAPPVKNDYNAMPGRPPMAMPMKPGQLMQEPYSGPMSAQEFARQGQAAMRARKAGQQPTGLAQALTPGGQPPQSPQPRRNLIQALFGRGSTGQPAAAQTAPAGSAAPAGGTRERLQAAMSDLAFLPPAAQAMALKRLFPEPGEGFTLGDTRFDAQGNIIASVPGKRESFEDAAGVRRYVDTQEPVFPSDVTGAGGGPMFGNSVEGKSLNHLVEQGILTPDQAAEIGAGKTITGPNNEIIFMTPSGLVGTKPADADGATTAPGRVITSPRKTEDQRKVEGFLSRTEASDKIIGEFEQAGLSTFDKTVANIPLVGGHLTSSDYQQLEQAQRDFVNAMLRRESGAAISQGEFDNFALQYFPQPGNDEKVLRQKAEARKRAIESLRSSSEPLEVFPDTESETKFDAEGVPEGVDPEDWKYMPEELKKAWR